MDDRYKALHTGYGYGVHDSEGGSSALFHGATQETAERIAELMNEHCKGDEPWIS